jgi:hypothetical protein
MVKFVQRIDDKGSASIHKWNRRDRLEGIENTDDPRTDLGNQSADFGFQEEFAILVRRGVITNFGQKTFEISHVSWRSDPG